MQTTSQKIRVWDPFIRVFHWSLVLAYAVAWASAEEWNLLHERVGYYILALVGLRIVWGLIGSKHARFTDFVAGPSRLVDYLRSLRAGTAKHYLGHNPAGGLMVLLLIASLLATGVTGWMMQGGDHEVWEDVHEGMANLSLLLVLVHVTGVVVSSRLHGENLVKAMISGNKVRENVDV